MPVSKFKKKFSDMPKEVQMEIIQASLPDRIDIVSHNSSGRYETYFQDQWVADLRLVSREFSEVATEKIAQASHCYFHETRQADEIPISASSLPASSILRIDTFPGFILEGCTRLIIIQSRMGVSLSSDLLDVSAFKNLRFLGLDIRSTTGMLSGLHWLSYKLALSAEQQAVQPLLAAFRKLVTDRQCMHPVVAGYDYPSHSFYGVYTFVPQLAVNLDCIIDGLCARDDQFCHDLIKIIGSDVLGLSRALAHGLKDDALFEAKFWATNKGKHIPVSFLSVYM